MDAPSGDQGERAPFTGDALEYVDAAVLELDSGSGHEVSYRAGNEHMPRRGHCGDARTDVNGDAAYAFPHQLDLTRMDARSSLEP